MHRYDGSPRQDDFVIMERENGRQIIAAVADGVGQAAQSHIGATTAVRYASQWLDSSLAEPAEATDWHAMVESTAWALVEQARAIDPACTDAAGAEEMLAATLVCAVVDASHEGGFVAHIVSVGDSGAWCLDQDGYTRVLGGKGESVGGISSSAVVGLPRVPPDVHATRVVLSPGEVLLLGTDGFGDPLGSGTGLVGGMFAEILRPGPPPLTEFGHALDFSRDTFDDDRTLVAIWRRKPAPADCNDHSFANVS
jgi:serine/threonine protein phosphatase PrpC